MPERGGEEAVGFQKPVSTLNEVMPHELRRRQAARKRLLAIAERLKGTGLSSVKLIREARQEAGQHGGRPR